jgi:hypothetical protein
LQNEVAAADAVPKATADYDQRMGMARTRIPAPHAQKPNSGYLFIVLAPLLSYEIQVAVGY